MFERKKIKSGIDFTIFIGAYALCLMDAMLLKYSTFGDFPYAGAVSIVLQFTAAVLILFKMFFDRYYSLKSAVVLMAAGILFLISYARSGYSHIFYLLIICMGMRNVDREKLIRFDFRARLTVSILIVFSALTGMIENYVTYRTGSDVLRYSLGFNHPNTVASLTLSMILEDAWIRKRIASWHYTASVWGLTTIIYLITANRTAVVIMAMFPIMLFFTTRGAGKEKVQRRGGLIFAAIFPLMVVFSYAAMRLSADLYLFRIVDTLLSNRFYNAYSVMKMYGISLFGQQVALISVKMARLTNSSIALLDVAYLRMLVQGGCMVLGAVSCIYGKMMKQFWENGERLQILILIVFLIFGVCESGFNNVFMNFTWLLAAETLWPKKRWRKSRV